MINHNFVKKNAKNNKTRRKLVATPSYYVQIISTKKKRNKNNIRTPQMSNKPLTNPLATK